MLLSAPGRSATVLVAFATSGDNPAAMSDGNVRSVPPPATAFITPPRKAATAATAMRTNDTEKVMSCLPAKPSAGR
jgi:hypothetical protein